MTPEWWYQQRVKQSLDRVVDWSCDYLLAIALLKEAEEIKERTEKQL